MFEQIPENSLCGYARMSSKSQESNSSLKSQKEKLMKESVPAKNILIEVGSATDTIRNPPIFQKLIEEELNENNLSVVIKIDHCS